MKNFSLCPLPLCFAAFWLMLLASPTVRAHMPPVSALRLVPDKTDLFLELTLNPFELTFFSELDVNQDGRLDPGEWTGQGQKIARRIMEALKVSVNDRPLVAEIAGVSQSYETPHIFVRAHFLVDARRARVSLESQLTEVTGAPPVTQVTFGTGGRVQTARLDRRSNKVIFAPLESADFLRASMGNGTADSSVAGLTMNETAAVTLLCLFLLAGLPPIFFCALVRRSRRVQGQVRAALTIPATLSIH
jgi:hypothetical protein